MADYYPDRVIHSDCNVVKGGILLPSLYIIHRLSWVPK